MKSIYLYTSLFVLFSFFACEENKVDIDRFGSISGTILDGETYKPLPGVLVATNPASSSLITTDSGTFRIQKILEGEVAVTARKKDYLGNSISVAVFENENTEIVFYLLKDDRDIGWIEIFDPVPGNGAVDQNLSFEFEWQVEQENAGKELEFSVYYYVSNSTVQNLAGENLTTTKVTVSGLKFATTYYWYVVAKHEGRRVANSPTWTFRTKVE